jgi:hypothetical protein
VTNVEAVKKGRNHNDIKPGIYKVISNTANGNVEELKRGRNDELTVRVFDVMNVKGVKKGRSDMLGTRVREITSKSYSNSNRF